MGWTISPFAVIVFGSSVVALAVGVAALRQRPDPIAWPLAALMFAAAAWALPHGVALGYSSVEQVAFWHQLRYPGTVLAPVAYLVVALRYAGYERWLSRRSYALLSIVPAITITAVWTNPSHGLFWESLSIATVGGASVLVPEFGPLYWISLGYLYSITVLGLVVYAIAIARSGSVYRKQAVLLFVAAFVPLATNVAMNFGMGPEPTVDLTTTALAVSGLVFALALFYFDLLSLRPVARDRLVEALEDGVVVVGPDGEVRDFNPVAGRIFDGITVGQPADELLSSNVVSDGGELVVENGGEERRFRPRSTPLTDGRDREIGRIVYLQDVTDVTEHEQRISVLNRILRHNVRNELNVVLGHLELLERRSTGGSVEHVETAIESSRRVVEFSEKARHVEQTLQGRDSAVEASATDVVDRVVSDARGRYPHADIAVELPERADPDDRVSVVDLELFELAVAELIENAVEHHDCSSPRVTVRVEPDGELISIRIADDGPGIPEPERKILSSRAETDLVHGSGLGLWLVQWTASLSAGELSIGDNEPRGTVVTLSLPVADGDASADCGQSRTN
ncbi:histidine kinase N-terminal 7TM domain-containing protein [Halalkaliarchaeum sp. AArc-GB]|uniref:histidine kinase N-terminal 7TM domain-containing protein n=1 Tax=Halalkaliarchaeum sp. AArc-GB TaxID=3074078 RepID=UPI0028567149|nr:histidine kinase N-terminal 7TM domain-containing protein [Halalkaliarchaeum sp. AArc-GB]MDR5674717.1 histidine kinase N-terminal 7TM domain-containing protein [Halalkaliarchaeum sp. AArc-GB]